MTARIIIAGILGSIAMFIWSFIGHDVLPLGHVGIREIPDAQAVLTAMQTSMGQTSGLYFFPGLGVGPNPTGAQEREAMKHRNEQLAANPSGILIYHPPGYVFSFGKSLGTEFGAEFLEALLVAFLLAQTSIASFGGRVGFALVAGILASIATNISYWNWYGFPGNYIAAYMCIQIVGFVCAGIVIALVLPKSTPQA